MVMASGMACVVAAPSKLQRPAGDRVKTDARDAFRLARLLKLDEIVAVQVPSVEAETARDLVRSREDTRQDLMGSRHRLSKLLLRHGFALAVEVTDWHRFTGRTIGSFLGLVPSEYSSGQSRQQGGITKTGNSHARRLLVEAAWHHRRDYRPAGQPVLQARWEKAPVDVWLRGQAGNERLHRQWIQFDARRKRPVIAPAGVAGEHEE